MGKFVAIVVIGVLACAIAYVATQSGPFSDTVSHARKQNANRSEKKSSE